MGETVSECTPVAHVSDLEKYSSCARENSGNGKRHGYQRYSEYDKSCNENGASRTVSSDAQRETLNYRPCPSTILNAPDAGTSSRLNTPAMFRILRALSAQEKLKSAFHLRPSSLKEGDFTKQTAEAKHEHLLLLHRKNLIISLKKATRILLPKPQKKSLQIQKGKTKQLRRKLTRNTKKGLRSSWGIRTMSVIHAFFPIPSHEALARIHRYLGTLSYDRPGCVRAVSGSESHALVPAAHFGPRA